MAWKAKKEVPPSPKAKAKAKSLKDKKAVLEGIDTHGKKICTLPIFRHPRTPLQRQPKYPGEHAPRRSKLDRGGIIKFLLTTDGVSMKKTEDSNTVVFTVDIKANNHQTQQAVRKLGDTDVAKVRP
ncbi:large ribosomal subunit protein uL23-like [Cavia porcellus]|uniref:large ribosomal subunit protein uL23-like n=1 Tax=Cavia porcellus TaxID=10141 RepID=UPI002FE10EEA